jgi:beta-xylosidase
LSWATGIPDYVAPKGCYNLAVWTVEIDLKTGDSVGEPQLIRQNTSFGNHVSEGPHVYKRNGYYYLMTAEGGTETEHSEWIFRSKAGPRGPWEDCPHNPLIYNGQDKHVMQTGHMDMVEGGDGQWWAVFLAVRNQKGVLSHLGRETFLAPVEWVEGWPVVNGGRKVSLQGVVGPPRSPNTQSWTFRFTNGQSPSFYGL